MMQLIRILVMGGACLASLAQAQEITPVPSEARQRELLHLLKQDCGACHGMTLQGGLGTPLTAEALRDKPVDSLAATILGGRPGTAMPPWKPFMSEQEARWLVELLQAGQRP
jgi:cytochrome c55X